MAPTTIKVSVRYGSHTQALLRAVLITSGDVLELGVGVFSTHALHAICRMQGRHLTTIENDKHWYGWGLQYATDTHTVLRIKDWSDAPIEKPWDVALIDHSPDSRRAIEIMRLAKYARYIVAHDADEKLWRQYGYEVAFPKFKYRLLCENHMGPSTMVLSNTDDLSDFWSRK